MLRDCGRRGGLQPHVLWSAEMREVQQDHPQLPGPATHPQLRRYVQDELQKTTPLHRLVRLAHRLPLLQVTQTEVGRGWIGCSVIHIHVGGYGEVPRDPVPTEEHETMEIRDEEMQGFHDNDGSVVSPAGRPEEEAKEPKYDREKETKDEIKLKNYEIMLSENNERK